MKSVINNTGVLVTPTMAKYAEIINSGFIKESDLIALNSFYNKSSDNRHYIDSLLYKDELVELNLSPEQNKKGFEFLQSVRFTPAGKERKNNPFGYREEDILDNFSHFTFCGFYSDRGTYYIRMYNCYSTTGNCFQYFYNGKVNIIG